MKTEAASRIAPLLSRYPSPFRTWPEGMWVLWLVHATREGEVLVVQGLASHQILALSRSLRTFPGMHVVVAEEPTLLPDRKNVMLLREGEALPPLLMPQEKWFLRPGDWLDPWRLSERLVQAGYERVDYVEEEGQWARRGGILDLFPPGAEYPLRLEVEGDRLREIRAFDPVTQRSVRSVPELLLYLGRAEVRPRVVVPRDDPHPGVTPTPPFGGDPRRLLSWIRRSLNEGFQVFFYALPGPKRLPWTEEIPPEVIQGEGLFEEGAVLVEEKVVLLSAGEIYPVVVEKRRRWGERVEDAHRLEPGDVVVHWDYGVGRFAGLVRMEHDGKTYDAVKLIYRDGTVYVPVHRLDLLERYPAEDPDRVSLSSLGGTGWLIRRRRFERDILAYAQNILRIHALRNLQEGFAFTVPEDLLEHLSRTFPYEETPDQRRALEEVLRDMASSRPMDRLLAGDVGFGKTEVAVRAAAVASYHGKQVLVLVPTTLLALQHGKTFRERLGDLFRVEVLSRFQSREEVRDVLDAVARGDVDVLIATPRVFHTAGVRFRDLGLLVIDEEHRFGVRQKEFFRERFPTVDTLRMTATPIPRTLYAALGKIYAMSVMEHPPRGRLPVATHVGPWDPDLVRHAVGRELGRGGQVFYVYNRIRGLEKRRAMLQEWFPGVRVAVAHGRMSRQELEDVFLRFLSGEIQILVATALLETGVDVPDANTLVVEKAELFGLAELHQLRGRVGRSVRQAYAYFLHAPGIREKARERLDVLRRYAHLGSGLAIAMMDLKHRGAGNLLGVEQHGTAYALGYGLFFRLVEEAMELLAGQTPRRVEVTLEDSAFIPDTYIPDSATRTVLYRRLFETTTEEEIARLREEVVDRFGPPPREVEILFSLARARIQAARQGFDRVRVRRGQIFLIRGNEEVLGEQVGYPA